MSDDLVERVARVLVSPKADPSDWRFWTDEASAAIAVVLEEAANPAFLRPLVEEQAKGEWDDKTIDEDVAMFAAAIRAMIKEPQ